MLTSRSSHHRFPIATLLGCWLICIAPLFAATGGFVSTLSVDQKTAAGLNTLSPEQSAALDRIVAAEVHQARQEDAMEFEGTFVSRRTDEERRTTGLDKLKPDELTKLNGLVAAAVAAGPKPRERPRIRDSDVFSVKRKPEVHGEISLSYGRVSGGGDFRAASMWVDYFDPNTGLGLGVGISQISGNGFYGFYPGYYGPPYYDSGFGYPASSYRRFGRNSWDDPDRPLYNPGPFDWNRPSYYRDFRRR